jgi:hypothetical protein
MALGTRRTPERNSPLLSGVIIDKIVPLNVQLTTGGGIRTLTPAEILGGLLTLDVEDAQSATLPTAALLNAAIPGVEVGTSFQFDVINFGDTTLTIVVGTGITAKSISGVAAVLTLVANASKRFRLVCTGVANPSDPSKTDTWDLYGFGSLAAATA